ncbi:MAG: polyhydroxyalkanoate granule-associated phasin [Marinobacter sp.]|uniref:polyhydroxyalkanoate granule-associated phasin n=1 Tax=Marinobacter sp. TaxID=50741 RepID=UPI0034A0A2AE
MPARRNRNTQSIAAKTVGLAFAVPQVVARRLARMVASGPTLSARDRKEFKLMGAEKLAAFKESWYAMALQTIRSSQALAANSFRSFWSSPGVGHPSARMAAQLKNAALGIVNKGIAPFHRKATANAKRLAHTKLR